MNYGKKSLESLYSGIAGKPTQPRKHLDVLGEAKVTFEYEGSEPETVEISDDNARELRNIANVSTTRNPMIMKVDGKWVGSDRITKKQIADTYAEVRDMADMGTIDRQIVEIATKATIFDTPVSSFNKTLKNIRTFLIESAKLTLEKRNESTSGRSIKTELSRILNIVKSGELQKSFVSYLDSLEPGTFDIWTATDPQNNNNNIYFALDTEVGKALQVMRPASDKAATRGAAGPGEALLAFLYGGVKPKGSGDILLSSGDEDSIELKKQEGRIGKHITSASVKALQQLFYGKSPGVSSRSESIAATRGEEPGTVYRDIQDPLPEEMAKTLGLKDSTQTIFSREKLTDIQNRYGKDLIGKHKFINKNGVWNKKLPNPPATIAANQLKQSSGEVLSNMSVIEFLDKYSGVTEGEKNVEFNNSLPDQRVSEVLDSLPGGSPRQKIANLIGVWHLKFYMSHINPFKWLLVYQPDGTAAAITYDTIINTPAIELVKVMNDKHLQFGIRPDDQGFHIEVHK
jgi:hypothetical protein